MIQGKKDTDDKCYLIDSIGCIRSAESNIQEKRNHRKNVEEA